MAYGSLATPKKPEEEHKIHPGWRPRARLGRQFPSDSKKKAPVLAPTCPAAPDSPGGAGAVTPCSGARDRCKGRLLCRSLSTWC